MLRRHDNDLTEIYTMLAHIDGVQGRHTYRLGVIEAQVEAVDTKVDGLAATVDGRGGGKADLAQGSGKDPAAIDAALDAVRSEIAVIARVD